MRYINTDTFYKEQVEIIIAYNPPTPQQEGNEESPETPVQPKKRIRQASIQTKTKLPVTT